MLHVVLVDVVLEEWSKGAHVFNDAGPYLGMFCRCAVELVGEGSKETIAYIKKMSWIWTTSLREGDHTYRPRLSASGTCPS